MKQNDSIYHPEGLKRSQFEPKVAWKVENLNKRDLCRAL